MQAINHLLPIKDHITTQGIQHAARVAVASMSTQPHQPQAAQPPARIKKLATDNEATAHKPTWTGSTPSLAKAPYGPQPLRYNWKQFAYTDGSLLSQAAAKEQGLETEAPRIGAAVHIPSLEDLESGHTWGYLPSEEDHKHEDTINRAKLTAIYMVIKLGCTRIASVSLTSLYQISTAAHRRQDILLNHHRHASLLDQIIQCVRRKSRPIQYTKCQHTKV